MYPILADISNASIFDGQDFRNVVLMMLGIGVVFIIGLLGKD